MNVRELVGELTDAENKELEVFVYVNGQRYPVNSVDLSLDNIVDINVDLKPKEITEKFLKDLREECKKCICDECTNVKACGLLARYTEILPEDITDEQIPQIIGDANNGK